LSLNKLPRQLSSCLGNCQFPSANNWQTNMASSDTDDDIIISSALKIASMLSSQTRHANQHQSTTDSRLFRSITYTDHCLNYLLPSKRNYTMQLRPKGHNFTLPIYTLPFLKTRSSIDVFLALYDYSFDCSFPSFISPLLNFSAYCIITLVVSIILC